MLVDMNLSFRLVFKSIRNLYDPRMRPHIFLYIYKFKLILVF